MITKFKLYESYNKPDKDDNDYQFKWSKWAKQELVSLFGEYYLGSNADWGGLYMWSLNVDNDNFEGYFLLIDDSEDEVSYAFLKRGHTDEEDFTDEIFSTTANENKLEELINCIGDTLPHLYDITDSYRMKQKLKNFGI